MTSNEAIDEFRASGAWCERLVRRMGSGSPAIIKLAKLKGRPHAAEAIRPELAATTIDPAGRRLTA